MRILTVNTGSSSLKAALYEMGAAGSRLLSAEAERIGSAGSGLQITEGQSFAETTAAAALPDHTAALRALFDWMKQQGLDETIDAAGHRVVHGGAHFVSPQTVTPDMLDGLRGLEPIDPDHLPQALAAIEAVETLHPGLPQVACFDTAFHRDLPEVARRYALPAALFDEGVRRYGFHGLSYEYVLGELRRLAGAEADGRVLLAHLGNGASMAAVRGGRSIETTMGFTPTGGLVMGTRSGDLDPGVLLYLLRQKGMSAAAVSDLVNKRAGLLGVSGSSGDMRDLLAREATDPAAATAVALFCYTAIKYAGALTAALGGLDTLVFTGGIGERAAPVRARICEGLQFLGLRLDQERNAAAAPVISGEGSAVTVRVILTDEDLMIARHTVQVLSRP